MKPFKLAISIVVLVASLFLFVNTLFSRQPIQIFLETGQEVATQAADYFSLSQVLVLAVSCFFIGSLTMYLYYGTEAHLLFSTLAKKRHAKKNYEVISALLKPDEKQVFAMLCKGPIIQSTLVSQLGLSKVRVTRILARLERKGLILKERHGMTNRIVLKDNNL